MSKTAVYLRVSTEDQAKGLDSQERAVQEYLDGHGIKDAVWYRDRVSGATNRRPALDRLERAIFMGQHRTVIVWALDRLTRRGVRDGLNLMGKWLNSGVRVVSITERFDFYGDTGELVASVLFWISKMFRQKLIENTKRGMAAAKKRGVRLGKRPTLFAKQIVPLLKEGHSVGAVARRLGKTRQAIYDCLRRDGVDLDALRQGEATDINK